ncbi:hypothetical protein [Endomicrobium proavitum]|uniref:Putative Organic solvent tolerance protein n=1 Tax=Endomicrobium proavitum TaxID=1408281 RepID=A0A0G3WGU6_9BACT|nr:hypothetical protein [Endomicrobium proavitum]AKL97896.1 putative Organic solvent tolerance protein [Endomicrobium proavitum]
MKKVILTLLFVSLLVSPLFAAQNKSSNTSGVNMEGMFALGYSNFNLGIDGAGNFSTIAARYWISPTFGIDGGIGFAAGDGNSAFAFQAKALTVLKNYSKVLNVYAAGNLGVVNVSLAQDASSTSLFTIGAGLGVEWFVVDNLSLSAELGLRLLTGSGFTQFGTYAGYFPEIGLRLYI